MTIDPLLRFLRDVAWFLLCVAVGALLVWGAELERREVLSGIWAQGTGGR